jgi:hypothetical protein
MPEFVLTTEELSLSFSLLGQPEAGRSLMVTQLGEMSEAEARARLMAAGHSLIARGGMALGPEGPVLNEDLARAVGLLLRADFSVRYSRATSRRGVQPGLPLRPEPHPGAPGWNRASPTA